MSWVRPSDVVVVIDEQDERMRVDHPFRLSDHGRQQGFGVK
jgi:hypothetical protein